MFGYIHANQNEMTQENKITYQAYYCGLCQKLRQNCGRRGQMLLNYDMTFLIILLSGLYELENTHTAYNCIRHPNKKQNVWMNGATDYAADMNVLLSYQNMEDDWRDDCSVPKKLIANFLKEDYARISKKYPRQSKAIDNYMRKLQQAENQRETNVDLVAGLTGEMMGEIFVWQEDEWQEELRSFGLYMGKFVYLMDAYEDFEKDCKCRRYNILSSLAKEKKKDYETYCRLLLTSMMAECAKSFERLPILQHADILRNIIYSGVWTRYELIQLKKNKKQEKVRSSKEHTEKQKNEKEQVKQIMNEKRRGYKRGKSL